MREVKAATVVMKREKKRDMDMVEDRMLDVHNSDDRNQHHNSDTYIYILYNYF